MWTSGAVPVIRLFREEIFRIISATTTTRSWLTISRMIFRTWPRTCSPSRSCETATIATVSSNSNLASKLMMMCLWPIHLIVWTILWVRISRTGRGTESKLLYQLNLSRNVDRQEYHLEHRIAAIQAITWWIDWTWLSYTVVAKLGLRTSVPLLLLRHGE